IFDWLRHLYAHLQYTVRFNGEHSSVFRALMGILIGDPASPTPWILYISDFHLHPHPDDVFLSGRRVSHLELADDMAMISLSHWGMQSKLGQFEDYCSTSFLLANTVKTLASVHGPLPPALPPLMLYGSALRYVETATLVGVTFTSSAPDIFREHSWQKVAAAERVASACYSLESYVGPLPPTVALQLYRAHVDAHLTAGCEIALDTHLPGPIAALERVQHTYLRRTLHISSHSQLAPLYSETGLWPIRYRQLHLALSYLRYVLTDKPPLPYAALWSLRTWSDLHGVAAALPVAVVLPLEPMPTLAFVQRAHGELRASLAQHLYTQLMHSQRLPVLQHRLARDACPPPPTLEHVCTLRDYLQLSTRPQRDAVTQLILSEHPLAIERLRRAPHVIPREWRVCRFCRKPWAVEDEVHVLLQCDAAPLASRREDYFEASHSLHPGLRKLYFRLSGAAFLDVALRSRDTLSLFAHFVADVFALCEQLPPLVLTSEDQLMALSHPPASPPSEA
ncbi:hypothetical protein BV20DRAFT_958508, partial [Pilatotrama ljubarskyi]